MTSVAEQLRTGAIVTPSKTSPWSGTAVEGSRWTAEQIASIERRGKRPAAVDTATVMLERPHPHDWSMPPEQVPLTVPCLARARRLPGRALIVAPAGDVIWIKVR